VCPGSRPRRGTPCIALRVDPACLGQIRCHTREVVTTVLIVDDHAPFRSVARAVLEEAGFVVVGEAADGATAMASARALVPDVVLLDVLLPDSDGFAVAQDLAGLVPPPAVVLVSTRDESAFRRRLAGSPACGFIPKAELSGDLLASRLSTR
jgi:DNA-binding NarL/FixJ family response regulator